MKAAITTAGPTGGGPGQRTAAKRGRCRRPHASPGTVRVEVRQRRRGDRPISPGSVAEGSNGRGGGGAGSARRGWTVGCQSRGTRVPQTRSGGVSVVGGRGASATPRGQADLTWKRRRGVQWSRWRRRRQRQARVNRWLLEPRNASSADAVGWRLGGGGSRCGSPATGGGGGGQGVSCEQRHAAARHFRKYQRGSF